MMAVLKDCIDLIPQHYKKDVDLATLPEDPVVYETLRKADTVGMFQVESRRRWRRFRTMHRVISTILWCRWRLFALDPLWAR